MWAKRKKWRGLKQNPKNRRKRERKWITPEVRNENGVSTTTGNERLRFENEAPGWAMNDLIPPNIHVWMMGGGREGRKINICVVNVNFKLYTIFFSASKKPLYCIIFRTN
jgi:hypothetical protein